VFSTALLALSVHGRPDQIETEYSRVCIKNTPCVAKSDAKSAKGISGNILVIFQKINF
jgi:hypothetical protein